MTIELRNAGYLNKARGQIISAAGKLGDMLHTHMCECLLHASKHGDVTLAEKLYKELPDGQRKESIKLWFGKMGPITARQGVWSLKKDWKPEMFKLEEAEKSPFWVEFGSERAPQVFSVASLINMLKNAPKRIEKAIKEQQEDGKEHFAGDVEASKDFISNLINFADEQAKKLKPQDLGFEVVTPTAEAPAPDKLIETSPARKAAKEKVAA